MHSSFTGSPSGNISISSGSYSVVLAVTSTGNTPPTASISGSTTGCATVTLTASGGTAYSWSGGLSPSTAANTFTASGTYSVIVTGSNTCTSTASQSVTVNSLSSCAVSPDIYTVAGNYYNKGSYTTMAIIILQIKVTT